MQADRAMIFSRSLLENFGSMDPILEPFGILTFAVIVVNVAPVHLWWLGLVLYAGFQYAVRFADSVRVEGAVNTDPTKIWREQEGLSVLVPKTFRKPQNLRKIPMSEVAVHAKRDDAWICVEGLVYDITQFVEKHPGGWLPISNLAGKDVTDAFANYHPAAVYEKLLPSYLIGEVADYRIPAFVKEHRDIRQELLRRGLFATRPSYYMRLGLWYFSLFFGAILMTMREEFYSKMVGALLFAGFFQQISFLGHDVGHNGVSHKRSNDLFFGICLGNITSGISLGWWKRSHNVHHVVCNSIENDPDIQHLPLFAVDKGILRPFYSSYHERHMAMDALGRWLVSYQHWLYYPAMFCARVNLYVQSYKLLLSSEYTQHRNLELSMLLCFAVWQSLMMWICLPTWPERLCYFMISHGFAGILHVQITISHFAEDCYHGQAYNNDSDEWFRMQVKGTMNVDCSPWFDWFHGGLQFQIEHHLFPRMPRHNLRECRVFVKALCKKHSIPYNELSFFRGNLRVLRKMRVTARIARRVTSGNGGLYTSRLYEALNAIG